MRKRRALSRLAPEFEGANLGDERRSKRLARIAEALDRDPGSGFPQSLGSEAELEAFYRFINNDGFDARAVLEPHIRATLKRARDAGDVIVVHDTTLVEYSNNSPRTGLGPTMASGRQGFLAHASLVLRGDGQPLGLSHLETLTRSGKKRRSRKNTSKVIREDRNRESLRWVRAVESLEERRDGLFEAIHVTDAEGDFFEFLAGLHDQSSRFVIRAGQLDRIVGEDGERASLRSVVDGIQARVHREAPLSERKDPRRWVAEAAKRKHPPRSARVARLAIGATRIDIRKTKYSDVRALPFAINIVRVWEPDPPEGESAIEWVLLTTEDVSTRRALERVVDIYRLRWTIEEFFKALKTGCSLEKRQITSYDALCKVLAVLAPIAYRLLLLRAIHRNDPTAPPTAGFSRTELHLLTSAPATKGRTAPANMDDALMLLARLGGHLKQNGPPGWQTLGRGYDRLLMLRLGWELARKRPPQCDQS